MPPGHLSSIAKRGSALPHLWWHEFNALECVSSYVSNGAKFGVDRTGPNVVLQWVAKSMGKLGLVGKKVVRET